MAAERYICCWHCNEIHHVTAFDKAPEYAWSEGEVQEIARDDWGDFMRRHAGHRLEGLKSVGDSYPASDRPADPMRVDYIEVTNGQELYLLRSDRRGIEEPRSFELIEGRLTPAGVSVEVQENEVRKEMKHHFSWRLEGSLSDAKIDLFIRLFQEVAVNLDAVKIQITGHSYDNPLMDYGKLEPSGWGEVIARCKPHFSAAEIEELSRFIDSQRDEGSVTSLRLAKLYMIEEMR